MIAQAVEALRKPTIDNTIGIETMPKRNVYLSINVKLVQELRVTLMSCKRQRALLPPPTRRQILYHGVDCRGRIEPLLDRPNGEKETIGEACTPVCKGVSTIGLIPNGKGDSPEADLPLGGRFSVSSSIILQPSSSI